ncbi:4'-demethylrebeccamycin synthase [Daldinia childiae]|uniref:4'-demethylrebeccamycin synthase n=1 Tax=Daldinia childiae TaxID=326645 RepID=UPI001445A258|nr:4'-demethylrebeccamycin synthase [Daldinia childiae]XP_033434227.1 4'-demethylrebeccamycin synthase [Daldinia childiae]XP_033435034.1 4'-demethylrebeccamycin synthase [Daldinia childiae]XP_033435038.1 4'-demethylrebeccamycin synthase [Daldinia childiae]XP_033435041.1 4'-demethylrebeccamycin synthase [Daldinia childiae]KAF3057625.1 4'-demethylrebeccamycin synthase [Daldinia childiae]KAF3057628.1 4'-demethylrebeccamycin synthase [Daldinia childiae]KAF3058929.1 4'-demethylrebeccamycin syntha
MTDLKPIQAETHRPFVLIVCHSLTGHLSPLIRIATALHALGWETFFLGPTAHRRGIEATGAVFLPLREDADLDDKAYYENPPFPEYAALHWADRVLVDLRKQCLDPLPTQWSCFVDALRVLQTRDPERKIILLAEAFFYGTLPLFYGASLPHDLKLEEILLGSLCVSVTIPAIRSVDLPPAGYPFPFDSSPDGRVRNANLWERSWERKTSYLAALLVTKMREAGADRCVDEIFLSGANYLCHDTILQLGVPGFEYPRSDWPPGFKFAGLVQGPPPSCKSGEQPSSPSPAPAHPRRAAKKKVIVVAQGTVEINPYDLIVPTLRAFANRSDVLVVAILGWKDANLSSYGVDIEIPVNARIANYLSYDAALAHANVWIHNAGFGAVNHGIANGVPMVVAGEGMDKTENSRRVAWSGIGIDLGCAKPSVEQVRGGVERVLEDERFTERVRELRKQSQEINCFDMVHSELVRIMKTRPGIKQRGLES